MESTTIRALLALNHRFYRRFADGFGASRHAPWSGWRRLLVAAADIVDRRADEPGLSVLDLGCGNARFARFLATRPGDEPAVRTIRYTGLDANPALLAQARRDLAELTAAAQPPASRRIEAELIEAELGERPQAELAERLGPGRRYDLVVLFGVLHHIPAESLRHRLLAAAAERLAPGGVLAVSVWRLDRQPRFERKRLPWSEHNRRAEARGEQPIALDQLEPGDHLLTWSGERDAPRYCHFPGDDELERWSTALAERPRPLRQIGCYEGDGRGDRDNLYLLWSR